MSVQQPLEVMEHRPSINEIIIVEQLPVIREQLELMRNTIRQDVDTALSLAVTEDTVKEVKAVRSRLNNDFKALEKVRIDVKKKILSPYEQFEVIYKECISSVYAPADEKLKQKIDEVENELKKAKQLEAETYFTEYCISKNIDFLTFQQANVVITLSVSKKRLKEQVKAFIDKVAEEVDFISSQENAAEVLVEYKKNLNAVQAMTMVANRQKALEAEQIRLEKAKEFEKAQNAVAQTVDNVVKETAPPTVTAMETPIPLQAPVTAPTHERVEKILTTRFTVRGTKAQLLALRKFLLDGGYDFE